MTSKKDVDMMNCSARSKRKVIYCAVERFPLDRCVVCALYPPPSFSSCIYYLLALVTKSPALLAGSLTWPYHRGTESLPAPANCAISSWRSLNLLKGKTAHLKSVATTRDTLPCNKYDVRPEQPKGDIRPIQVLVCKCVYSSSSIGDKCSMLL